MTFSRPSLNKLKISGIPSVLADLLLGLPTCGDSLSPGAEARIYQLPTQDPGLSELSADWRSHVHGDLRAGFLAARDAVREDVGAMVPSRNGEWTLTVPPDHAEAWVSATTQARLALADAHAFTEEELSQPRALPASTPRELIRLQMDFYAAIQEWLIEALD